METVYASDIHETYRILEKLFRILYIISGDLICEFGQYRQRPEKKGRGPGPVP
jgi:hypothetical protein